MTETKQEDFFDISVIDTYLSLLVTVSCCVSLAQKKSEAVIKAIPAKVARHAAPLLSDVVRAYTPSSVK